MKHEMIFGDEKLFAGIPEYVEFIRYNSYSRDYLWGDLNVIHHLTFKDLTALPIVAMRRIIREPKRWTVEDQKAGRLPDVGAELLHESEGYVNFVGEFDFRWMLRTKEGGLYLAEKFYCSPLETPEEKADRLRNEWINEAINAVRKTDVNGYESIYDALLSGTLSVPTKGGE